MMMSPSTGILKQTSIMDEGSQPIYLDTQATTPMDPRMLDAILSIYTSLYGNPHSRTHAYHRKTEKAISVVRELVVRLIGANLKEISFTLGGLRVQ
ncbi:hypothetical protein HOY80DRAFT_607048 [Tuber brumale]|nr:hypothetical protein HOY80DRAFT_607048 [Tuber brumale]